MLAPAFVKMLLDPGKISKVANFGVVPVWNELVVRIDLILLLVKQQQQKQK